MNVSLQNGFKMLELNRRMRRRPNYTGRISHQDKTARKNQKNTCITDATRRRHKDPEKRHFAYDALWRQTASQT